MASGSLKTLGAMATKNPFSMGHATRSFASEQLKDRHPYLEPPFRSGVDPREIADAFGNRRMTKVRAVNGLKRCYVCAFVCTFDTSVCLRARLRGQLDPRREALAQQSGKVLLKLLESVCQRPLAAAAPTRYSSKAPLFAPLPHRSISDCLPKCTLSFPADGPMPPPLFSSQLVEVLEAGKLEDPDEYAKALRYFIGNLSDQARCEHKPHHFSTSISTFSASSAALASLRQYHLFSSCA